MMLLDTNIIIYLTKDEAGVVDQIRQWRSEGHDFSFSVLSIVELFAQPEMTPDHKETIDLMIARFEVINLTPDIAYQAGRLRREHRMGLGDSIIAATALNSGFPVVTRNINDFKKVKDLKVVKL